MKYERKGKYRGNRKGKEPFRGDLVQTSHQGVRNFNTGARWLSGKPPTLQNNPRSLSGTYIVEGEN